MTMPTATDRQERYDLSSIEVWIDGAASNLLNVSASGILIGGKRIDYPDGAPIQADLIIPLFERKVGVRITGTVARRDETGFAITYASPARSWARLLTLLAQKETGRAAHA